MYCRALPRIETAEQLRDAHAVTLGYVSARIPKKEAFKLKYNLRQLERFATAEDLKERGDDAHDDDE